MLEPQYQLPPPDLIDAVNDRQLVFLIVGYVEVKPFILVEWATGLDADNLIIGESLYRDGDLLLSQSGNELRQSLTQVVTKLNAKANLNLPVKIEDLLGSSAIEYGLSELELSQLNDPSNFVYLNII